MPSEVTGEVLGVTIDARDTKDVDDGFWLDRTVDRGYRVVVAIAGVGQTIRSGSMLDARARERVATRYRPWGNEPMLPFRLSEDRLALLPNRRRRAVVVEVYLRPDLELAEPPHVFLASFRSLGKLSYGRVAETLAAAPGREEGRAGHFRPLLEEARALALRLLERRRAAGALAIYDLSNGWVSTEEGFLDHRVRHHPGADDPRERDVRPLRGGARRPDPVPKPRRAAPTEAEEAGACSRPRSRSARRRPRSCRARSPSRPGAAAGCSR